MLRITIYKDNVGLSHAEALFEPAFRCRSSGVHFRRDRKDCPHQENRWRVHLMERVPGLALFSLGLAQPGQALVARIWVHFSPFGQVMAPVCPKGITTRPRKLTITPHTP